MLFKNNYIHKYISVILLVMLLLIHSIKLLHTHSGNTFSIHYCSGGCIEKNDNSELAKSSSDCGICSYQLTKDADDLLGPECCNPIIEQPDLNTCLLSCDKFSLPAALENRGPPAVVGFS